MLLEVRGEEEALDAFGLNLPGLFKLCVAEMKLFAEEAGRVKPPSISRCKRLLLVPKGWNEASFGTSR